MLGRLIQQIDMKSIFDHS